MRTLRRHTVKGRLVGVCRLDWLCRLVEFARFDRDEIRIFLLELLFLDEVKYEMAGNILRAKPG